MANFYPGQRVRIKHGPILSRYVEERLGHLRGAETQLEERAAFMDTPKWPRFWRVAIRGKCGEPVYVSELYMEPLTDPKADEWAADKVKQVTKPLMVERPVYTKERA